jgi:carbon-monoxide dehydrogenase medium subunit
VRVGALARHAHVHRDAGAAAAVPLLSQALSLVAHPVIRNRGTTVGSLAHADPSGEMTAGARALGGSVELISSAGSRTVTADGFFRGPLETCLAAPGELVRSAWFPALPARSGSAFREVSRRHGDYAMCGVAAAVTLDERGAVARAATSYISMTPTPVVLDLTDAVRGSAWDAADWDGGRGARRRRLDPEPDIHATADYRPPAGPGADPAGAGRRRERRRGRHRSLAGHGPVAPGDRADDRRPMTVNGVQRTATVPSRGCCRTTCATTCG